jgi:glycosyltransferase involved in cell wall biosynthesis
VTKVAFVVNGGANGSMGQRARAFAAHLAARYDVVLLYRSANKVWSIVRLWISLIRFRPAVVYIFDMAYSGVAAASFYKAVSRTYVVIETGDAIYELAKSMGHRGRLSLSLTGLLERWSLRMADKIVVRGTFHKEYLGERGLQAEVIPDGVDTSVFSLQSASDLRKTLGLDGVITVGVLGWSIWNQKSRSCYGAELIEVMRLLKDEPVKAVLITSGSGVGYLKERCRQYGLEDRVMFLGYIPYLELPTYLNLIDICLSTQTNDVVGWVRTTGKLPLYMACGRFILASRVGEAAYVLNEEMLVDYDGVNDESYPQKLVERIHSLLAAPDRIQEGRKNISLAKTHFEYSVLARRLDSVIQTRTARARSAKRGASWAQS